MRSVNVYPCKGEMYCIYRYCRCFPNCGPHTRCVAVIRKEYQKGPQAQNVKTVIVCIFVCVCVCVCCVRTQCVYVCVCGGVCRRVCGWWRILTQGLFVLSLPSFQLCLLLERLAKSHCCYFSLSVFCYMCVFI